MYSAGRLATIAFLGVVFLIGCGENTGKGDTEKTSQVSVEVTGAYTEGERADLTADADRVERGRRLFSNCGVCHSVDADVPSPAGPHLEGVLGRRIASVDSYPYTNALSTLDGVWSVSAMDAFIENPMAAYPGTSMAFGGISDAESRNAVIAYLASLTSD